MVEFFTLILLFFLIIITSTIATIVGFGSMLLLIAALSIFIDIRISIALATLQSVALHSTRSIVFKRYIDFSLLKYLSIGIIPGALVGLYLFGLTKSRIISILFGFFILIYVIHRFLHPKYKFKTPPPPPLLIIIWSFIYSIASALIGAAGPLLVILIHQLKTKNKEFSAMMGACFLILGIIKLIGYSSFGLIDLNDLDMILVIIISPILGTIIGRKLIDKIPKKIIEKVILILLLAYSLKAISGL